MYSNGLIETSGGCTGAKTTGLDGSKITGGTVEANYIAGLPASKITSGTFDGSKIADGAVSTGKIANLAVTGAKTTGLDGSKITDGTIAAERLPAFIGIPGTGLVCAKTSGAYTTTYNTNGVKLPWGFYNFLPSNTADLEIYNSGGFTACKALAAGWYLFEIGYQIQGGDDLIKFPYSWNLTPVLWKNGSIYKWGSSANYISWLDGFPGPYGFGNDFAQSSFVVPMAANDYVIPGYFWSRSGDASSATIIKITSTGYGTYFSAALLDKG